MREIGANSWPLRPKISIFASWTKKGENGGHGRKARGLEHRKYEFTHLCRNERFFCDSPVIGTNDIPAG